MEAKRLLYLYTWVKLEARSCKAIARTWVATVEDRHIIFLCHSINSVEELEKVFLGVNILFTVSREENVFALFQSKTLVNVRCFNLGKVLM